MGFCKISLLNNNKIQKDEKVVIQGLGKTAKFRAIVNNQEVLFFF